jgi:hypothetical protein
MDLEPRLCYYVSYIQIMRLLWCATKGHIQGLILQERHSIADDYGFGSNQIKCISSFHQIKIKLFKKFFIIRATQRCRWLWLLPLPWIHELSLNNTKSHSKRQINLVSYIIFFHCFRFIVTNNGSGHSVTGLR